MADELKIEGVRLEELEPISVLDDEAIFLVSTNKVCRIISLSSLRKSFAGNPTSQNKDEVYYNATYIDNKFEIVENNITEINDTVKNFTTEIEQQVQNISQKIDKFTTDINNKVEEQINNALTNVQNKLDEALEQVDQKLEESNTNVTNIGNKVEELKTQFTELSNQVDQKIQDAIDNYNTELSKKVVYKSTKVTTTLPASGWNGDGRNPPFSNAISVEGVTATNNVEILLPGTATLEQVEAWCGAGVVHGTQTENSITLLGYGDIPEIDIPIEIIIRKDI